MRFLLLFSCLILILIFFETKSLSGQTKAILTGKVVDENDNQPLPGVTIILKGTQLGAVTNIDGLFNITGIVAGNYNVECSSIGYQKTLITDIRINAGETKKLDVSLKRASVVIDQEIVIVGRKPLIDVEEGKSSQHLDKDVISNAPSRQIEEVLNTQTGVVLDPEGIHIRGGRTYETGYYIDDVSAKDPLAGTGFGLDVGTNSIDNIDVLTSSSDVQYGNSTSGVVNTQLRSGGDRFKADLAIKGDNFGLNRNWQSTFNTNLYELSFGGPIKIFKKESGHRLRYFTSLRGNFTDTYLKDPPSLEVSSLYPNPFWTPRMENHWSGNLKINYDISPSKRLSFSYLKTISVNQDGNTLRITGDNIAFAPGFQYPFADQPDNANTYTHDANLESIQWSHSPSKRFGYKIVFSRFFAHLRTDANGLPWRPTVINGVLDPASIQTYPVSYYNPKDSAVFVNPVSGFYNNGGIATLWHDHYDEELTIKPTFTLLSNNQHNTLSGGAELKRSDMQWIDITRPWIGAPIILPDGQLSQSYRLGSSTNIWQATPYNGAFFINNQFKFRGLIANTGLRYEYWMPGALADNAVKDPNVQIPEAVKQGYMNHTISILGMRAKTFLLPKLSASFPIKENQVLYFNYGQSTILPHPSYIYNGLNPYFTDRSTLSSIGNPDLNPEVDISYELGLKSQISGNDALNLAAYWKDKYNYITSGTVLVPDVTGQEVSRTMPINSDYARIRGVEVSYQHRIKRWFEGSVSVSYSVATGQSSSNEQTIKDILTVGNRISTKELPLAWDSPIDAKAYLLLHWNDKKPLWHLKFFNKIALYNEWSYRTGRRYTPYILDAGAPYNIYSGRPNYVIDPNPNDAYSKIGTGGFLWHITLRKSFIIIKKLEAGVSIEITNVLNSKLAQIYDPITGKAYKYGDPVPFGQRDPLYSDPRDPSSSGLSPLNPARYEAPRHILLGFTLKW